MAELEYKEAKDLSEEQHIVLLYGKSGVGKSTLVAQIPDVLILLCDPGKAGGFPDTAKKYNPKVIKIESYAQMLNLIPVLKEKAGKEFKALAVDSVSFLQRVVISHILRMAGTEIPRFDEWNLNAERMRKILEQLCEVPCHVIFTALDGQVKDEVTGATTGGADLPGKLAGEFPRYCSTVARLTVNSSYDTKGKLTANYIYTCVGDSTWSAKDRTGLIPLSGPTTIESFMPLFK